MNKFLQIYRHIISQQNGMKFNNNKIAVLADSFKIPFDYDVKLLQQLSNKFDYILVDIGNNTISNINNRIIAKSNIERLAKIFSKIETTNNKVITIISKIKENINSYTYNQLVKDIEKLKTYIKDETIIQKLDNYQQFLQNRLYQSVKYINDKQITGQLVKNIFQILISENYILKNKIIFKLSQQTSPLIDAINFINLNCNQCQIYVMNFKNNDSIYTYGQYLKSNNDLKTYIPTTKQLNSRQNIINKFNLHNKQYGYKLISNDAYQKLIALI